METASTQKDTSDPKTDVPVQISLPSAALKDAETLSSEYTQLSAPPIQWLEGTWYVTHSTLPMWKSKRNVRITYTALAESPGTKIDDFVEYQEINDADKANMHSPQGIVKNVKNAVSGDPEKWKNVRGVDTSSESGGGAGLAYDWQGRGWLKIARSHWEVLGYGTQQTEDPNRKASEKSAQDWMVTYFTKTPFTPAGIDVYSRIEHGTSPSLLRGIHVAIEKLDQIDREFSELRHQIFEIKHDRDDDHKHVGGGGGGDGKAEDRNTKGGV